MDLASNLRRKAHTLSKLRAQFQQTWRRDGALAGIRFCVNKATALVREKSKGKRIPGAVVSAQFDKLHGVDTTGLISMSSLSVESPNSLYATVYKATDPERFKEVLDKLPIRPQDFIFVDFGSGKGLALLLASHYPFRKVRGVEFASELHTIAEANIRNYRNPERQCTDVAAILGDAAAFDYPNEPTVVYMYHPFDEELMSKVAMQLEASYLKSPRPIILWYAQPRLRKVWEDIPSLSLLFDAGNKNRDGQMVPGYAVFGTPEVMRSATAKV